MTPAAEHLVEAVERAEDPREREALCRAVAAYADAVEKLQPEMAGRLRATYGLRRIEALFSGVGSATEVAAAIDECGGALRAHMGTEDRFVFAVRRL